MQTGGRGYCMGLGMAPTSQSRKNLQKTSGCFGFIEIFLLNLMLFCHIFGVGKNCFILLNFLSGTAVEFGYKKKTRADTAQTLGQPNP